MSSVGHLRPGTAADRVDGVVPPQVAEPDSGEAFAGALKHATARRLSTVICGGGSKLSWGRPPETVDLVVSTSKLTRLIAHRHGDLTATVQAGMRLSDFNAALRGERQWLPVESAFDTATIGGIVATNDAGPSRHHHGTPRDLVIGMTVALTDGRVVKAGGTVVKNVAGYDVGKLLSGSHGTLAGIVDVTFKLVPIPQASATVVARYDDAATLARDIAAIDASQIESAKFDVSAGEPDARFQLKLCIATSPAARDAQIAAVRGLVRGDITIVSDADERTLWTNQNDVAWHGDATVRFSWLPSRLPQVLELLGTVHRAVGVGVVFVGRALGAGMVSLAGEVPELASAVGRLRASADVGNVVLLRGSHDLKATVDVWGPERSSDRVARSLKQTFDPAGVLNAGRGPV